MAFKHQKNPWLARMLANLAAIVAVSTIFGVKAMEIERRTQLAEAATPFAAHAAAPGPLGSVR